MWTLTLWAVIATGLVLLLAYALHRWIGIRRDVMGEALAARADGFWEWLWIKAKARWDVTVAAVIAIAPVAWSVGLDTIVIIANLMANIVPALSGIDLSNLMISPEVRTVIQLVGLAAPPLRDAIEKMRGV